MKNLIINVINNLFSSVLSKGTIYFITIFFTHILSSDDFATYSLFLTATTLFAGLSTLGTSSIIINGVSNQEIGKDNIDKLLKKILPISSFTLSSTLLILISKYIDFEINIYLSVMVYIIIYLLSKEILLTSILSGISRYDIIAKASLLKSIVLIFMCNRNVRIN